MKKEKAARFLKNLEHHLSCPICGKDMQVKDLTSLICWDNHTFDFAKQGYVNMLNRPVRSNYTRELFAARQEIIRKAGLFNELHEKIAILLKHHLQDKEQPLLLDAGAGEGSHIAKLLSELNGRPAGVGIDLAKEGIRLAAGSYEGVWLVADLASIPFKENTFDVILNILSPANYQEFDRVLKEDGVVVKVVPGSSYLLELRGILFEGQKQATYSNDDTAALFTKHFAHVKKETLTYTRQLSQSEAVTLLKMTPLAWNRSKEPSEMFKGKEGFSITIDLDILMGKRN